jgi:hypothetical protein
MAAANRRSWGRLLAALLLLCALPADARADDSAEVRRAFRAAQRSEDWKERRAAYVNLLDYDGVKVYEELVDAILQERNAAVILEGIKTLGQFESDEARAALLDDLRKPKGRKAEYLLLAMSEQKGAGGEDVLVEILKGKDEQLAGLAAVALGRKATEVVIDPLLRALAHKDWHVVSAAARAIRHVAWSAWTTPKEKNEKKQPAMPAWFDPKLALWPLVDALEKAKGRPRADLIEALESITAKDYGDNWQAWVAVAKGEKPSEAVLAKRVHPPYFFGIPVHAKRVVIVLDTNVRTEDMHPFQDRRRLQELCEVPGAYPVPWYNLKTSGQFMAAHVMRFIKDMPTRGVQFELILSGVKPKHAFGKLKPSNGGTKKVARTVIEKISVANGNDILGAMTAALDISGSKDSVAMSRGPDQILCTYASIPWLSAETDSEVVGAEIGLKARLRLVPIHAVGVREFSYGMMETFATQSGGRYLPLQK